jgi:plasmid stability protein
MNEQNVQLKTVNLDERVHRRLKIIASENGVKVNYLVTLILTNYFQQYDQVRQETSTTENEK